MILKKTSDFIIKTYLRNQFPKVKIYGIDNLNQSLNNKKNIRTVFVANYNRGLFPIKAAQEINAINKNQNTKVVIPINLAFNVKKFEKLINGSINKSSIINLYEEIKSEKIKHKSQRMDYFNELLSDSNLLILPTGCVSSNGKIDFDKAKTIITNPGLKISPSEIKEWYSSLEGKLQIQPIHFLYDPVFETNNISIGPIIKNIESITTSNDWFNELMRKTPKIISPLQIKYLTKQISNKKIYNLRAFYEIVNKFVERDWIVTEFYQSKANEQQLIEKTFEVNDYANKFDNIIEHGFKNYCEDKQYFVPWKQFSLNQLSFRRNELKELFEEEFKTSNPEKATNFWNQF